MRASKYPEGPKSCRLTPGQSAIWSSSVVRAALDGVSFPENNPENWQLESGRSIDTVLVKKLIFLFIEKDIEAEDDYFEEKEMSRIMSLIEEMRANGEI